MKQDTVNLDQQMLKILYEHYKSYLIPIVTIVVCILVAWLFIVPQMKAYSALQVAVNDERQKVNALQKNYDILSSINGDVLSEKMDIVSEALPDVKDFVGVLRSFSIASSLSGVTLGDYSLTVGDVSGKIPVSTQELSLSVTVAVAGDLSKIESFLSILQKQLPLSNVSKVSISNNSSSSVTVLFYYAPFPDAKINPGDPLALIPSQSDILIAKLKELKSEIPVSTNSATLTPPPSPSFGVSPIPTISSPSATPTLQPGL